MVPLPKTQPKVVAVIRAQALFLALQKCKHLPGLLQNFRKEMSSGACIWVFPAFFYFLSVLGSSAFLLQLLSLPSELLAAIYTFKRGRTTKSCWQQLSFSRMRQGAPSALLAANSQKRAGARSQTCSLCLGTPARWEVWEKHTVPYNPAALGSCGVMAIKDNHPFPSCSFLSHSLCGHSPQVATCSTDCFVQDRRASVKTPHLHPPHRS